MLSKIFTWILFFSHHFLLYFKYIAIIIPQPLQCYMHSYVHCWINPLLLFYIHSLTSHLMFSYASFIFCSGLSFTSLLTRDHKQTFKDKVNISKEAWDKVRDVYIPRRLDCLRVFAQTWRRASHRWVDPPWWILANNDGGRCPACVTIRQNSAETRKGWGREWIIIYQNNWWCKLWLLFLNISVQVILVLLLFIPATG